MNTQNQPQFSQTMIDQFWLGKTKPTQAFQIELPPYLFMDLPMSSLVFR